MMTAKVAKPYRDEGAAAFAVDQAHQNMQECPYPFSTVEYHAWIHGWWREYYKQVDQDAVRIAEWLSWDGPSIFCVKGSAEAFARMLTICGSYNRRIPSTVKICDMEFIIPAAVSFYK